MQNYKDLKLPEQQIAVNRKKKKKEVIIRAKLYVPTTFQGSSKVFSCYNKPMSDPHFIGDESETENLGHLIKFASLLGSGRFQTRQSNSKT